MFIAVCFALSASSIFFLSKKIFNSALSPIGTFCGTWFTVLFLYHLKLFPFNDLQKETWICLLGGILIYLIGCFIIICVFLLNKKHTYAKPVYTFVDLGRLRRLTFILYLIGMLGFLFLFLRIIVLFGPHVFMDNRHLVHDNFAVRFLGYPFLLNCITPVLAYLHFRLEKKHRKIMAFIVVSCMLVLLFSVSRTNFIRTFILILSSDIFLHVSKRPVLSIAIACLAVLFFFASFQHIKNPNISESIEKSAFKAPGMLKQLGPAYGYVTAPLPTFEAMRKDIKVYGYGKYTFNTLTRFLRVFFPDIEVKSGSQMYYRNPIPCNVYTYQDVYYKDFGDIGIIVFSLLQGLFTMYFYMKMVWRGKVEFFLFNSVISWCLIISFFSNHFVKNSTIFLLICSYFIGKHILVYTENRLSDTNHKETQQ